MHTLPHRAAILAALAAFAVTTVTGLCCGVPPGHIIYRGLAAALVFGFLGHAFGRVFLQAVCDALSEHLHEKQKAEREAQAKARLEGEKP